MVDLKRNTKKELKGSKNVPLFYLGAALALILVFSGCFTYFNRDGKHFFATESIKLKCLIDANQEDLSLNTINGLFLSQQRSASKEAPEMMFVSSSAVIGVIPPLYVQGRSLGVIDEPEEETVEVRQDIVEYTAIAGDDLASIAERFGISLNTLLWANDLNKSSKLKVGQSLIILPVSGVIHYVENGDMVSRLAVLYKANAEEVIEFNNLPKDGSIMRGDILVIPGGTMPAKTVIVTGPVSSTPLPSSYFLLPVPSSYRLTQGLHWYNAVDFANGSCGGPVYAAAGGEVQKTGHDKTAGNYVRIIHPNKVVTFYGHFSKVTVSAGDIVSQGQVIGYIGNTGYTIGGNGCHLHFGVYGAKNPFAK
ncbi:MAG: peptidoglycan DD-metalloendopeptidase family protein [bacterium]